MELESDSNSIRILKIPRTKRDLTIGRMNVVIYINEKWLFVNGYGMKNNIKRPVFDLCREMEDRDMTMEEYIQYETEKALRNGKVYNWKTGTYGKILYNKDVQYLRFFETEFSAIIYNDAFTSKSGFSSEPMINP
nr:hypothetical protein [Tanacetum cinerariifolium]